MFSYANTNIKLTKICFWRVIKTSLFIFKLLQFGILTIKFCWGYWHSYGIFMCSYTWYVMKLCSHNVRLKLVLCVNCWERYGLVLLQETRARARAHTHARTRARARAHTHCTHQGQYNQHVKPSRVQQELTWVRQIFYVGLYWWRSSSRASKHR